MVRVTINSVREKAPEAVSDAVPEATPGTAAPEAVHSPCRHHSPRRHISRKAIVTMVLIGIILILLAVGCQPKESMPKPDNGASVDLADFQWSKDSDCSICHIKETETIAAIPCPKQDASAEACAACHDQEPALATVHQGVVTSEDPGSSRLKATSIDEQTCLECHEGYEALAVRTADVTTLTDDNGLVVNPHDVPESGNHDEIYCTNCHVMHGKNNAARRVCVGCHHMTVWECNTCHSYEYEDSASA